MNSASTLSNGVPHLWPAGDYIGSPDTQQLLQTVNDHLESNVLNCAVDLSNVRYIDDSGTGALVSLLTKFRSLGGEMVFTNSANHSRKTLVTTKLINTSAIAVHQIAAHQQLTLAAS